MDHEVDRRDDHVQPSVQVRTGLGTEHTPITVIQAVGEHAYASRWMLPSAVEKFDGHVIVDLTRCTFLDNAVISALLRKALALGKRGYRLEVVIAPFAPLARKVERLQMANLLAVRDPLPHH